MNALALLLSLGTSPFRRVVSLCLLAACLGFSVQAQASPPVVETADPLALLQRFREQNAGLHTLQAEFTQEKQLALLAETLVSSGRLCVSQSADSQRLLWEYTAPEVSGFVYDGVGATVWMRRRSAARTAGSTETQALAAMSAHVLTWVRADPDTLAGQYHLSFLALEQTPNAEGVAETLPAGVRLVPRKENPFFSAIEVRFSPTLESLHSLRLAEPAGDTMLLRFFHVVRNTPPAPFCQP